MEIQVTEWMSFKQVAGHFGISPRTVRRMVDEGKFPKPVKIGSGCVRFQRDQVVRFAESLQKSGK